MPNARKTRRKGSNARIANAIRIAKMANKSMPIQIRKKRTFQTIPNHTYGIRFSKVFRIRLLDETTPEDLIHTNNVSQTQLFDAILEELSIATLATGSEITAYINRIDSYVAGSLSTVYSAIFYAKGETEAERNQLVLDTAASEASIAHLSVIYPPTSRVVIRSGAQSYLLSQYARTLSTETLVEFVADFHCDVSIMPQNGDTIKARMLGKIISHPKGESYSLRSSRPTSSRSSEFEQITSNQSEKLAERMSELEIERSGLRVGKPQTVVEEVRSLQRR